MNRFPKEDDGDEGVDEADEGLLLLGEEILEGKMLLDGEGYPPSGEGVENEKLEGAEQGFSTVPEDVFCLGFRHGDLLFKAVLKFE